MANLTIQNVDEQTIRRLRERAATHGVSLTEEARRILRAAVTSPQRLGEVALEIFGPEHGIDSLEIPASFPSEPHVFAE